MKQIAIQRFVKESRQIIFFAEDEVANLFVEFGSLYHFSLLDKHTLYVKNSFDFNDVVQFMDGYGL